MAIMTQLMKVCNHPRGLISNRKDRVPSSAAASAAAVALGGDSTAIVELEELSGEQLIVASSKFQLLDKLLLRVKEQGSRHPYRRHCLWLLALPCCTACKSPLPFREQTQKCLAALQCCVSAG